MSVGYAPPLPKPPKVHWHLKFDPYAYVVLEPSKVGSEHQNITFWSHKTNIRFHHWQSVAFKTMQHIALTL